MIQSKREKRFIGYCCERCCNAVKGCREKMEETENLAWGSGIGRGTGKDFLRTRLPNWDLKAEEERSRSRLKVERGLFQLRNQHVQRFRHGKKLNEFEEVKKNQSG